MGLLKSKRHLWFYQCNECKDVLIRHSKLKHPDLYRCEGCGKKDAYNLKHKG